MRFLSFFGLLLIQPPALYAAVEGEIGPFEFGTVYTLQAQDSQQAFRIESYGEMVIQVKLSGKVNALPPFYVEGPLEGNGDLVPLGKGPVFFEKFSAGNGSSVETQVKLRLPGLYRVIIEGPKDRVEIQASCSSRCYRPSLSPSEFLRKYRDEGQVGQLLEAIEARLRSILPESPFSEAWVKRFRIAVAKSDFKSLDHFPVVPMTEYENLRGILTAFRSSEAKPDTDTALQGELEQLLGPCDLPRAGPEEMSSVPKTIKYGHFTNLALTACQNAHSESLAHILTSLGVGNQSWVRYKDKVLTTPSDLINALIQNGHEIELRQERTFANFLSFTLEDKTDLRWPLWIDTGLEVSGKPLIIPSGHSQHAWRISGPLVNTRITFFMGMYGAAFHSQTDTRPAWSGNRVAFTDSTVNGAKSRKLILKTFEAAELYLQVNRKERNTVARGLPSDGYGYLGICNDSDCFLEMASRGTFSSYPLVRNSQLNSHFLDGDFSGDILKKISDDTKFDSGNRKDILRRIYDMRPYSLESELWFDEDVRLQMKSIRSELGYDEIGLPKVKKQVRFAAEPSVAEIAAAKKAIVQAKEENEELDKDQVLSSSTGIAYAPHRNSRKFGQNPPVKDHTANEAKAAERAKALEREVTSE